MIFPSLTAFYGGILGLIFAALTVLVGYGRSIYKVFNGDGGNDRLRSIVRAHGNYFEYVPLLLVLIGLLEMRGGSPALIRTLLITLCVARVLHPIGIIGMEHRKVLGLGRGIGATLTLLVLIVASAMLVAF